MNIHWLATLDFQNVIERLTNRAEKPAFLVVFPINHLTSRAVN